MIIFSDYFKLYEMYFAIDFAISSFFVFGLYVFQWTRFQFLLLSLDRGEYEGPTIGRDLEDGAIQYG